MKELNLEITENFMNLIQQVEGADDNKLRNLRKNFILILEKIGAKQFVTIIADILKNNFRIEGCNDYRLPLKKIFAISLEELEENLSQQAYDLPDGHPLVMLCQDHKDNIKKLKALRFSLGGLSLNKDTVSGAIKDKLRQAQDYYRELDSHIRKEEEVLFVRLEENGMQEHPENLKEEHKGFREALSKIVENLTSLILQRTDLAIEEVKKSKEKFISDISNHIFRETYVFYPAALEFIKGENKWSVIKDEFGKIDASLC